MQLSRTAEYALRAMSHLALLEDDASIRGQDLSEATAIPQAYISKVMRHMVRAGLVNGQKGHGGGFTLARPREEIHFSDVLSAIGVDMTHESCAFGFSGCDRKTPCALHFAWTDVLGRFRSWANETTLDDVKNQSRAGVPFRLHGV